MTELDKKITDLKDFIKEKTDQGTANYLGKEIREICGMVETEQLILSGVVGQREQLECDACKYIAIYEGYEISYLECLKCGKVKAY